MCGIIGASGAPDLLDLLIGGLQALEYRGYDSAGVGLIDPQAAEIFVARAADQAQSVEKLQSKLSTAPDAPSVGIGHTRWATHGAPTEENAHPQLDCHGSVAVVHNGIIANHRELAAVLTASGHRFTSATDTEVIAHLVESEMADGATLREAVRRTMALARGDLAVAVIALKEPETIVVARRTSPIIVGLTDTAGFVGSDIAALLPTTRDLYVVGDDQIAEVRPGRVEACNIDGEPIELQAVQVSWDVAAARKDGYADFMSKEIHEQPHAVAQTLLGRVSPEGLTHIEELAIPASRLAGYSRVFLIGCGSSYHAALVGRQSVESLARMPAGADIASEFRYRNVPIDQDTLVVAISQSGETIDSLHAIRDARSRGAGVVTVTNVVDSVMARESDGVCYTHAGPEICVASTKCHVAQLAILQVLALHLANARGSIDPAGARAFADGLGSVAELVDVAVGRWHSYLETARRFAAVDDVYFLGRRSGLPIAMEGALKLKELAYVRAEAYPAGELKHGPISLIEPGVVVVAVATRNEMWEKIVGNLEEVKARGATVVAIADDGDEETAGLVDAVLPVPPTPELLTPIVAAVATQCFAYSIASARGTNVDRPRNLAKVVTVE